MDDEQFRPTRIRDMGSDEKPREKAINLGIHSLTDAELIAIILGGGIAGMSVLDLARTMLRDQGGDVSQVARLQIQELTRKYKGVGPAKAVSLSAAFELGARAHAREAVPRDKIKSAADVYALMRGRLELCEWEEFWALMLARNNTVKHRVCISQGGTAATVVDVKLLLKRAIDCLADSMILVHNHPSGATVPSPQDDALTRRIAQGAQSIDVRVLDHIIIGRDSYYSYADQGKI